VVLRYSIVEGYTALKHYISNPKLVKIGDTEYYFHPRANISMAWVKDEHVDKVLAITKQCCGGNRKSVFRVANEADIRRHTNGGGR